MTSGRDILILLEKIRERLADQYTGKNADPSYSFWSRIIKKYLFKFFKELRHRPVFFYVHGLEMIVHLQHSYVAFACSNLIPTQLSYSIISREFDH